MPGLSTLRPAFPSGVVKHSGEYVSRGTGRVEQGNFFVNTTTHANGPSNMEVELPHPSTGLPVSEPKRAALTSEHLRMHNCTGIPRQWQNIDSYGNCSSGSEHDVNDVSSVCLAAMVSDFMEEEGRQQQTKAQNCRRCRSSKCDGNRCQSSSWVRPGREDSELRMRERDDDILDSDELSRIVKSLSSCCDPIESTLFTHVVHARKSITCEMKERRETLDVAALRRSVMGRLRASGYNAAVCKSRWDHSKGFPGGDYEYIDVVDEGFRSQNRILVDIDFRAQFQVARPTLEYESVLDAVPIIFVGRLDKLLQLVDLLTNAMKRSLLERSMHVPPWRKAEYMRAKWLSPYKRTTNEVANLVSQQGQTVAPAAFPMQKLNWPTKGITQPDLVVFKGRVVPACIAFQGNAFTADNLNALSGAGQDTTPWELPSVHRTVPQPQRVRDGCLRAQLQKSGRDPRIA